MLYVTILQQLPRVTNPNATACVPGSNSGDKPQSQTPGPGGVGSLQSVDVFVAKQICSAVRIA